jgi:hypothetical protein
MASAPSGIRSGAAAGGRAGAARRGADLERAAARGHSPSIADPPIGEMLAWGMYVSVSTDDRGYFSTTLEGELPLVVEHHGVDARGLARCGGEPWRRRSRHPRSAACSRPSWPPGRRSVPACERRLTGARNPRAARGRQPEPTSRRPITPPTTTTRQVSRASVSGSSKATAATTVVPAAPMPVKTA